MAGRPRTRARRAAEAATAAAQTRRLAELEQIIGGGCPNFDPEDPDLDKPPSVPLVREEPPSDRAKLREWSEADLDAIERSVEERRTLLDQAGPHPSQIIARRVLSYGIRGVPKSVAARLLKLTESELEMHYGDAYVEGSAEGQAQVAANLQRIATSSNDRYAVKAATEILNRRGGEEWKPPAQKLEVEDSRKGRGNVIDASTLSFEERQALREKILGSRAPAGLIPRTIEGEAEETE